MSKLSARICASAKSQISWLGWLAANYGLLVMLLVVCKAYFFIFNRRFIESDTSWLLYAKGFVVGLRFDLAVAAYFHFVLILLLLTVWLSVRWPAWHKQQLKFCKILNVVLAVFFIFFLTADAQFYHEFSQHLSFKDTDYLSSPELMGTIITDYPLVIPAIFITLLSWIYARISSRIIKHLAGAEWQQPFFWLWRPLNFVLAVGLLVIAARGGIGLSNLNWGAAIFSSNPFANQLALNGLFSFGKSWDMEKDDDGSQVLKKINISYDESVKILQQEFSDGSVYNSSYNPLQRVTSTGKELNKKNVVVILLESWMAEYVGALGSQMGVTPCFDSLSSEGVLFTNFYAGGTRSNRGIVSVVTGYPSHYGKSVMKQMNGQNQFYSIPGILKDRGYQTSFIYGGDPEFDNMQGFLFNNGVDKVIGQNDFLSAEISGKWGVNDQNMFKKAVSYLNETKQPFFSLIFTISNHEPFEVPTGFNRFTEQDSPEYKYLNTYCYSDQALGQFFKQLKKMPFYSNTIFVLVADHGKNRFKNLDLDPHRYHVPLLILNSGLKPQRITTTGGQTDILPTVLSLLGGEFTHASWGRNLLTDFFDKPFYLCQGDFYGLIKGDTLLSKDMSNNSNLFLVTQNNKNKLNKLNNLNVQQQYDHLAGAYFALSYSLLKKGNYGKERNRK